MGTIQNAFNQMLGVATGGISTAKLLSNQAQEKKIGALNLADAYEKKATEFNKDVENYEKAVDENTEDIISTINQLEFEQKAISKPGSEQWKKYDEMAQKALESFNVKQTELYGIHEGLAQRRAILEERNKLGEKILGKNKFSNIKLSKPNDLQSQVDLTIKGVQKRGVNVSGVIGGNK